MLRRRSFLAKPSASAGKGKATEERAAYDEIISSFSGHEDPAIRRLIAKALFNKGVVSAQGIRFDEARAAFDALIKKYQNATDPELQLRVVTAALVNRGVVLSQQGRIDEALAAYHAAVERYGAAPEPEFKEQVNKGAGTKARPSASREKQLKNARRTMRLCG